MQWIGSDGHQWDWGTPSGSIKSRITPANNNLRKPLKVHAARFHNFVGRSSF